MLKLFAGLALACLVSPAVAQPLQKTQQLDHISDLRKMVADTCLPEAAGVAALRQHGDTVTGPFPAPGAHIDALYIDLDANGVWLWAVKDGCIVPPPMHLDLPPGAAPKPTVLHGRGVEIGV